MFLEPLPHTIGRDSRCSHLCNDFIRAECPDLLEFITALCHEDDVIRKEIDAHQCNDHPLSLSQDSYSRTVKSLQRPQTLGYVRLERLEKADRIEGCSGEDGEEALLGEKPETLENVQILERPGDRGNL